MMLRMWSTDIDGNFIEESDIDVEVPNRAAATAQLVGDLYNTASDDFLLNALTEWVVKGSVTKLPEGNDEFWNAELVEV